MPSNAECESRKTPYLTYNCIVLYSNETYYRTVAYTLNEKSFMPHLHKQNYTRCRVNVTIGTYYISILVGIV